MAKVHLHGIISVLFVIAAMIIGFIAIFYKSSLIAFCYAMIVLVAYCVIAAVYCSKCQCRDTCNHLFVGMLSKLLSRPNKAPYTKSDMFYGAALPIGITVSLPQFWLFKSPLLLICIIYLTTLLFLFLISITIQINKRIISPHAIYPARGPK